MSSSEILRVKYSVIFQAISFHIMGCLALSFSHDVRSKRKLISFSENILEPNFL